MSDIQTNSQVDPNQAISVEQPSAAVVEEFDWLMSLALDDMLDADERVRFDGYVRAYPSLAAAWSEWMAFDRQLVSVPHALPATGFFDRFETHLLQREQQERRQVLVGVTGAIAVVVLMAAVGFLASGAYVLSTQGPLIGEQVRNLLYVSAVANNWIDAVADSMLAILNAPQARALVAAYAVAAGVFILWWIQLLRRSARLSPALTTSGME